MTYIFTTVLNSRGADNTLQKKLVPPIIGTQKEIDFPEYGKYWEKSNYEYFVRKLHLLSLPMSYFTISYIF